MPVEFSISVMWFKVQEQKHATASQKGNGGWYSLVDLYSWMTDKEHNLAAGHKGKFTELTVNLTITGGPGGQGVVCGEICLFYLQPFHSWQRDS